MFAMCLTCAGDTVTYNKSILSFTHHTSRSRNKLQIINEFVVINSGFQFSNTWSKEISLLKLRWDVWYVAPSHYYDGHCTLSEFIFNTFRSYAIWTNCEYTLWIYCHWLSPFCECQLAVYITVTMTINRLPTHMMPPLAFEKVQKQIFGSLPRYVVFIFLDSPLKPFYFSQR